MNSNYIISGQARRRFKAELHNLKRFHKRFWYYHQLEKDICGSAMMSDEDAQQMYDNTEKKIVRMEEHLAKTTS